MSLSLSKPPAVKTSMLVRAPVKACFNAFIDPAITTKFWFTKSSGELEAGKRVRWEWEMYAAGSDVDVKEIEPNKRILIEWSFPQSNIVEWTFTPHALGTTVEISNRDFKGDGDAQVQTAIESMGGWCFVLASLKAWLEHGVTLNVVEDKSPDNNVKGWKGRA